MGLKCSHLPSRRLNSSELPWKRRQVTAHVPPLKLPLPTRDRQRRSLLLPFRMLCRPLLLPRGPRRRPFLPTCGHLGLLRLPLTPLHRLPLPPRGPLHFLSSS